MKRPKPAGDEELVRRSRAGDRQAFGQLVNRYESAACAAAASCLGNAHDVMDVVQDAFVTAYCKLGQLRQAGRFGPWLRTIVRRRALEWIRSRPGSRVSAFALAELRASSQAHQRTRRQADLREAVEILPERYREVVLLHYLQRWSYRRIAVFTGLPVTTVKGRLQVARTKLKECLQVEGRAPAMKSSKVRKNVEESIYKIATEEIHQTIPVGDADNVVLFCGVYGDIEVCQTEGNDVVLNGTKASLGATQAEAQASAAGIQILCDQVEDYLQTGPHEGELFAGTDIGRNTRKRVGISLPTAEAWLGIAQALAGLAHPFLGGSPYEDLPRQNPEALESVRAMLAGATRITIVREKMEDIVLPREAWTEQLQRVFCRNSGDEEVSHGPVGRVSLSVGVPVGRGVTVISAWPFIRVHVADLGGDVNILGSMDVEVADVTGNVCLLEAFAKQARNIGGWFVQTFYGTGPGDPSGQMLRRGQIPGIEMAAKVRNVQGQTWIDVARLDVEAAELLGGADIRNCFGTTRLYKAQHRPGTRDELETHSGNVMIFLNEDLLGKVSLTATSLCGRIRHEGLKALGSLNKRNDLYLTMLSTMLSPGRGVVPPEALEADICVKTRDGDVTIERIV